MNYIKRIFSGRIGRKNYGLGLLFFIFLAILVIAVSAAAFSPNGSTFDSMIILFLYIIFVVHIFSLHARRFHDLGQSSWNVFLFLIPLVNLIVLIYLLFSRGEGELNQYGESQPKDINFFNAIFNRSQNTIKTVADTKVKSSQYCSSCGVKIEQGSKFCYKCGNKIFNS